MEEDQQPTYAADWLNRLLASNHAACVQRKCCGQREAEAYAWRHPHCKARGWCTVNVDDAFQLCANVLKAPALSSICADMYAVCCVSRRAPLRARYAGVPQLLALVSPKVITCKLK